MGGYEHAAHIKIQDGVEFFECRIFEWIRDRSSGVVYKDVEFSEFTNRLLDRIPRRRGIGGVRPDGEPLAPSCSMASTVAFAASADLV